MIASLIAFSEARAATVYECAYDFQSLRTKDRWHGYVRVTANGLVSMSIQLNGDPVNECKLKLLYMMKSNTASLAEIHAGEEVCTPKLTQRVRTNLLDTIRLYIGRKKTRLKAFDLEGLQDCKTLNLDTKGLISLRAREA